MRGGVLPGAAPMTDFLRLRLSDPVKAAEVGRLQDNIWTSLTPINAKMARSTNWTVITAFLNGWGPYDPPETTFSRPQYRVDLEGFLHLEGVLTDASGAAVASLTLPAFHSGPAVIRLCHGSSSVSNQRLYLLSISSVTGRSGP